MTKRKAELLSPGFQFLHRKEWCLNWKKIWWWENDKKAWRWFKLVLRFQVLISYLNGILKIPEDVFLELVPNIFESSWKSAIKIVNCPGFQIEFQKLMFTIIDINWNSRTHAHMYSLNTWQVRIKSFLLVTGMAGQKM